MSLCLDETTHKLTRSEADALQDALSDALTETREFLRTVGEHRGDGTYVVSRRNANSAGHSKVFDSFRELERLFEGLSTQFTAEDVGRTGLTGGRRHMLVHHLTEHPAFDCTLAKRQPLTARKQGGEGD